MDDDVTQQRDELEVLQSIFPEEFCGVSTEEPPFQFTIIVPVQPPHETLRVAVGEAAIDVSYLPPLSLNVTFPPDYPSAAPPCFSVRSPWLSAHMLDQVCEALDRKWKELEGMPVVFTWVEFLKENLWAELGLGSELRLMVSSASREGDGSARACDDGKDASDASAAAATEDACEAESAVEAGSEHHSMPAAPPSLVRASSGLDDEEADERTLLVHLFSYNRVQAEEAFARSDQECEVCYSELPGTEFVLLPDCRHHFCRTCVRDCCEVHIRTGSVEKLKCLRPDCSRPLPESVIIDAVGEDQFAHLQELLLSKALSAMRDVVHCPVCQTPCVQDMADSYARCPKCFLAFCTLCFDKWHAGDPCSTASSELSKLDRKLAVASDALKRQQLEAQRLALMREAESEKALQHSTTPCPSCGYRVSRTSGCNKMTCICGRVFCYLCGKDITSVGYDHFGDKCPLFSEDVIREWEQRMAAVRPRVERRVVPPRGADAKPCPLCRQFNNKVYRNNHMRCWACGRGYCFVCGKQVQRTSEHFGPTRCPQHS